MKNPKKIYYTDKIFISDIPRLVKHLQENHRTLAMPDMSRGKWYFALIESGSVPQIIWADGGPTRSFHWLGLPEIMVHHANEWE